MKKIISLLLSVVMVLGVCACDTTSGGNKSEGGYIEQDKTVPDEFIRSGKNDMFEYSIYGRHAEITKYIGTETDVVIPEGIENYKVTVIGERAFIDRSTVKTVHIPKTVEIIAKAAFQRCYYLEKITGCEGLVTIQDGAFCYDRDLKEFPWTDSLTNIGTSAFMWCSSLERIEIVPTCNTIGDYAFRNCTGAKELVFSDSEVNTIGKEAFMCLSSITSLHYPYATGTINEGAFKHAAKLKNITFDPRVTVICNRAFQHSQEIVEIVIPEHITTIEQYAFGSCKSIERATFENPYTVIYSYVFLQVENVTMVGKAGSTAEFFVQNNVKKGYVFEELAE